MKSADSGLSDSADQQSEGGHQMRCPFCGALQFLSRNRWELCAVDQAALVIKCWRRRCKRILPLRHTPAQV